LTSRISEQNAGKLKRNGGNNAIQSHKKISANVAGVASDSEADNSASLNGSDSEEEVKKSKKRSKKDSKAQDHAQYVDILNQMDPKARKKLCKHFISSESVEMDKSTIPVSSWYYNRLERPFVDGMTVGVANEQIDNNGVQLQIRDQGVTEESLTSELQIQNTAIPKMQIHIPATELDLLVMPPTYLQLFYDTEVVITSDGKLI
jgi:hypothetical protein